MRTVICLVMSMWLFIVTASADVVFEPPVAEQTAGVGITVVFAGAAVVCVVIAVLVWFIRKRK